MHTKQAWVRIAAAGVLMWMAAPARAQENNEQRINALEQRVRYLEQKLEQALALTSNAPPNTALEQKVLVLERRQELADEIEGCADFWYPGIGTSDGMGCDNKGNAHSLTAQARSRHGGGVNACFADGHVQFVQDSISLPTWVQLQSIRDGQMPERDY